MSKVQVEQESKDINKDEIQSTNGRSLLNADAQEGHYL